MVGDRKSYKKFVEEQTDPHPTPLGYEKAEKEEER